MEVKKLVKYGRLGYMAVLTNIPARGIRYIEAVLKQNVKRLIK